MYKVFSMDGCSKCVDATKLLTANGIAHEVVKVDEDEDAWKFIQREGHRAMPQIYKEGVLIPGGFAGLQQHLK